METINKELIEFIIIHHSATIFDCPFYIKLRHKFLRGWDDIGYHFIIGNGIMSKNGKIYTGRPINFVGAHAHGHNKISIGICLLGNFDKCTPTFKQYRSLIKLIKKLKNDGYLIKKVLNHNETEGCQKTCPGTLFPMTRLRKFL